MHANPLREPASPAHAMHGTVRCYACGGMGTVTGPRGSDPVADRAGWPALPCLFTTGCGGLVEPEALN